MKNCNIPPFKVINWDFNGDTIEYYDIMPYLVECWKEDKKRKYKLWKRDYASPKEERTTNMPQTFEEFKTFILNNAQYQFWARCEYEVIVTGWPVSKRELKIDIYDQIKNNIDAVTLHFRTFINKSK